MDQLAIAKPLCKAAYRVLHAQDIGIGFARAIRAAVSGRPGGVYLDLPAKLFAQVMNADAGAKSLVKVIDAGAGADPRAGRGQARARRAEGRQASADHPRQGRRLRPGRRCDPRPGREERRAVPADEHGQGPAARHASAVRRRRALDGAEGFRRRDADRRPAQLAPVARQGQDLGRRAEEVHPGRHRAQGDGQQRRDRGPRGGRHRLLRGGAARGHGRQLVGGARRLDGRGQGQARRERRQDGAAPDEQQVTDGLSRRAGRAAHDHQGAAGRHPGQRGRQHARPRARRDRHVQAAQAARRRHLGRHGRRHGLGHRRRRGDRPSRARDRGRQRLRLLGHGGRDDLPLPAAGLRRDLQQRRHLSRHRPERQRRARIPRRRFSSRARATTR